MSGEMPVLRALRLGVHALTAVLLVIGLVRALPETTSPGLLILTVVLTCAFGAVYLFGTAWEYRRLRNGSPAPSRALTLSWLAAVLVLWVGLLGLHAGFVWLAFPLMFLVLNLAGGPTHPGALAGVALLWSATWALPWWHTGVAPALPEMLGPGVGAVVAVLISAVYRSLHAEALHHRRVAEALRAAQAELAATEHHAGQLAERERLSREIHDTLAQGLSSLVLVSRAAKQHPDLPADTAQALELIESTAGENLAEARRFVHRLAAVDTVSLPETLTHLVERTRTELALLGRPAQCTLSWQGGTAETLPEPLAAVVLRTVQVGLGNVVAHAAPHRVVVTVGVFDDVVTVDVFDDGAGFVAEPRDENGAPLTGTRDDHSGKGLSGLARRVRAVQGRLEVESTPGAGTVLGVRIPRGTLTTSDTGAQDETGQTGDPA